MNNSFEHCVQTVLNRENSSFTVFENKRREQFLSNSTISEGLSISKSHSQEDIYLVVEEISIEVVQQCCNCSEGSIYDATDSMNCNEVTINELISRLMTYLGSSGEQNKSHSLDMMMFDVR